MPSADSWGAIKDHYWPFSLVWRPVLARHTSVGRQISFYTFAQAIHPWEADLLGWNI